jgi:hypothetical protein
MDAEEKRNLEEQTQLRARCGLAETDIVNTNRKVRSNRPCSINRWQGYMLGSFTEASTLLANCNELLVSKEDNKVANS